MALKLIVFACVLALCYCQMPARPMIPETFTAKVDVERHRAKETVFGKGVIAWDQGQNKGVENDTVMAGGKSEMTEDLKRFDQGMEYFVTNVNTPDAHCTSEKRSTTLEPYFGWVEHAKFEGKKEIRHKEYDFWTLNVGGLSLELAVEEDAPNVPVYFNRKEAGNFVLNTFTYFNSTAPSADMFLVPKDCQMV